MKSDVEKKDITSLGELKYDAHGLIPAIVVEDPTAEVLMMAYMNRASLAKTLETGNTWFFSRSRQKLWMKGETSGNIQKVFSIKYDCDLDTLLVRVNQTGPACHTEERSCFYRDMNLEKIREALSREGSASTQGSTALSEDSTVIPEDSAVGPIKKGASVPGHTHGKFDLDILMEILKSRKKEMPDGSYTTSLFKEGPMAICAKIEEESDEVIDAVFHKTRDDLIWEIGDLFYHTLALMAFEEIEMGEVLHELERRHQKKSAAT